MTRKRPSSAPPGPMSDAQFRATVAELQRVVLDNSNPRPELRLVLPAPKQKKQ